MIVPWRATSSISAPGSVYRNELMTGTHRKVQVRTSSNLLLSLAPLLTHLVRLVSLHKDSPQQHARFSAIVWYCKEDTGMNRSSSEESTGNDAWHSGNSRRTIYADFCSRRSALYFRAAHLGDLVSSEPVCSFLWQLHPTLALTRNVWIVYKEGASPYLSRSAACPTCKLCLSQAQRLRRCLGRLPAHHLNIRQADTCSEASLAADCASQASTITKDDA